MRSVGFDSLVPSAGSMTRNDTCSDRSRLRLPRNTDFFAFLCPLLTPRSQHLCQRVGLPLRGGGLVRAAPFFSLAAALATGGAVAPSCGDSVLRGADDP